MTIQVDYQVAAAAHRAAQRTRDLVEDLIDSYPKLVVGALSSLRDSLETLDDSLRALLEKDEGPA